MRSLWLLHELGLDFDLILHGFGKALRSTDYLALHPLGRVPLLIDGDVRLMESGAICEYLCETRGDRTLWRAPGDPERAQWLQWLHFAETLGVHCASLTQQHIVIYEDKDRSPLVMKLEVKRLGKGIGVLEAELQGRMYLLTSGFSAIDTGVGYSLHIAQRFVDLTAFPNVSAYLGRLSARGGFQRALPPVGANVIYLKEFYPIP